MQGRGLRFLEPEMVQNLLMMPMSSAGTDKSEAKVDLFPLSLPPIPPTSSNPLPHVSPGHSAPPKEMYVHHMVIYKKNLKLQLLGNNLAIAQKNMVDDFVIRTK